MNEVELLARLIPTLATNDSVVAGAGDDCAVLDLGLPNEFILFKTDAIVEGVHFTQEADAEKIGHKALARCLSDVAAMAGTPTHALITLALPQEFDVSFVEGIYRGLNALAARHEVAVVGGETTANLNCVLISVAVLGTVAKGKCLLRSGAQAGDAVFVTGTLGGSLQEKHLEFEPRLIEARWLAEHCGVHAMMDLSDGLATDLRHLLKASQVGAELLASAIPISRAARLAWKLNGQQLSRSAGRTPKPPLLAALTDGEDFELLFTVESREAVPLLDAWKKRFPELGLNCIGKITSTPGLFIKDKDGLRPLTEQGYVHFS
ncbi:MAG: thiamine-monophosphate kinase [Verrucomicrobia bacterium]|nr:thiamine-monophosphate kinase [Verrucomicrobiota bacterium]